jgi:anion-transporting  ArsA/GET3 family ATPase
MAMEKLHELVHQRRYQLLVVDTPPSAHIRDLLAAPNRLLGLLASRAVGLLKTPASLLGLADSAPTRIALSALLKALQRWTGLNLLSDLSDFMAGFEHMIEGFVTRAEEVTRLLRAPSTAFVLVTTADARTVETTIGFHQELAKGGYPVAGIIANRVLSLPALAEPSLLNGDGVLERKLWRTYRELRQLAQRDEAALARLRQETGLPILATVAASSESPTTIAGLERFAGELAGRPGIAQ